MALPFTVEQFLGVFASYNEAVWPAQILLYAIAILIIALIFLKKAERAVPFLLAALWLWTGIAYHIFFFSGINGAAYAFGALFILEGLLLAFSGLRFSMEKDLRGYLGLFLIAFALFLYPLLNLLFGHSYPAMPTFGLPCPLVIFTFGVLLLAERVRWWLLLIPFLWSLIGISAAISLGVWEDMMLVIAGIVSSVLILKSREKA